MIIKITPEIIEWIESSKKTLRDSPKDYRFFGPGMDQVVDAYDEEMGDKTRKWTDKEKE